jgi:hypothetical protein
MLDSYAQLLEAIVRSRSRPASGAPNGSRARGGQIVRRKYRNAPQDSSDDVTRQ